MTTKPKVRTMKQEGRDVQRVNCSIRGHCRTNVYAFPKEGLFSERRFEPRVILENAGAKATVVTDLKEYFEQMTPFRHYRICALLRKKVDDAIDESIAGGTANHFPIFIALEQESASELPLDDGLCYVNQQTSANGRTEDKTFSVWHADSPGWTELAESDTGFVNTVLAAVKAIQVETGTIREVAEASCFYEEAGRAVYPRAVAVSISLEATSFLRVTELEKKVSRLGKLIDSLEARRGAERDAVRILVDALRLEDIDSDDYRRGWYLSLFEATKAVLSRHYEQQFNQRHRDYRKTIGHPKPGTRLDMSEFNRLQRDALAEVRRVFLGE